MFRLNSTRPKNQILLSKSQWPLRFAFSYVQPITKCYRRKTVEEVPQNPVTMKIRRFACPNYQLLPRNAAIITLRFQLFSALQTKNSVTIVFAINLVTTEKTDNSHLQMYCREAIIALPRIDTLSCQQKEMEHKGGQSKSMMRALYVLRMSKGTSRDEATLNSEKIKPIALAVIELCLPEGIRQAVKFTFFLKFHNNLLEAFRMVLKALLGLVIPNQYCQGAGMEL